MDYKRIYAEFIKNRRRKELGLTGYTERHHIRPKCMGGKDVPKNLVRLTPEDHYFAHLLLAKAYGGANWAALYAMCNLINEATRESRSKLHFRIEFGHVRRSLAAYYRTILAGPTGKIADKREHELVHLDGRVARGNRFELSQQTSVTRQQISALLRGAKKLAHGWYTRAHNPRGLSRGELISFGRRDHTALMLFHHDGRTWSGTKIEFCKTFGAPLYFQHPAGNVRGWYRTKKQAQDHGALRAQALSRALAGRGDIRGAANPNADPAVYQFRIEATGEVIAATKLAIRARFDIKASDICSLFNGSQKTTHGIALHTAQEPRRAQHRMVRKVSQDSRGKVCRPIAQDGRVHEGGFPRDL